MATQEKLPGRRFRSTEDIASGKDVKKKGRSLSDALIY